MAHFLFIVTLHLLSAGLIQASLTTGITWDTLIDKLSPMTSIALGNPSVYIAEYSSEFELESENRTNYDLFDEPSGVCMAHLYCGFNGCDPLAHETSMTLTEKWAMMTSENANSQKSIHES
jgi:hypothetical protein